MAGNAAKKIMNEKMDLPDNLHFVKNVVSLCIFSNISNIFMATDNVFLL